MKVKAECASCLLHRGYLEIMEATKDSSLEFKAVSALTNLLAREFKPKAVPACLCTKEDRLIKKVTGNLDPYVKKKEVNNQMALEILPLAESLILSELSMESRFRKACLYSIVSNVIEFDTLSHAFTFEDVRKMIRQAEEDLAIDEIPEIFSAAKKAKRILYLTDNAGEIAFDTLFVYELKRLGICVTVAVKDKPVFNDATFEDATYVGMHEVADKVITTGTGTIGLVLEECSDEFLTTYRSADLVVVKGMGYAQSLTEFDLTSPHALLFRTKCKPIAEFFNVDVGKNIAKLMS